MNYYAYIHTRKLLPTSGTWTPAYFLKIPIQAIQLLDVLAIHIKSRVLEEPVPDESIWVNLVNDRKHGLQKQWHMCINSTRHKTLTFKTHKKSLLRYSIEPIIQSFSNNFAAKLSAKSHKTSRCSPCPVQLYRWQSQTGAEHSVATGSQYPAAFWIATQSHTAKHIVQHLFMTKAQFGMIQDIEILEILWARLLPKLSHRPLWVHQDIPELKHEGVGRLYILPRECVWQELVTGGLLNHSIHDPHLTVCALQVLLHNWQVTQLISYRMPIIIHWWRA